MQLNFKHLPWTSNVRIMFFTWTPFGSKTSMLYWPESVLSTFVIFSVPLLTKNSVRCLYASWINTFSFFRENTFMDPVGSCFLHRSWWPLTLVIIWTNTDPPRGAEQKDVLWLTLHFVSAAEKKAKEKTFSKEIHLNASPFTITVILQSVKLWFFNVKSMLTMRYSS